MQGSHISGESGCVGIFQFGVWALWREKFALAPRRDEVKEVVSEVQTRVLLLQHSKRRDKSWEETVPELGDFVLRRSRRWISGRFSPCPLSSGGHRIVLYA
jgi:hypothetical protein